MILTTFLADLGLAMAIVLMTPACCAILQGVIYEMQSAWLDWKFERRVKQAKRRKAESEKYDAW